MITRRDLLMSAAGLALAAAPPAWAAGVPGELRIGFQKNGAILVAKQQGAIERRLSALGVGAVKWIEFPAGPPLLEALSVGSIDVGATGDTPPIFAQAAGADLLYVARIPASGSAILVPESSPLRSLADLKGTRVAFTKGSSSHNVTVEALKKADSPTPISPRFISARPMRPPPSLAAASTPGRSGTRSSRWPKGTSGRACSPGSRISSQAARSTSPTPGSRKGVLTFSKP